MSKGLFITGTGTDIGKTFVSGLLVKKLHDIGKKSAYFKAAMSGNERRSDGSLIAGDAQWVKDCSGISQKVEDMCPYVYENLYSPHLASRIEGNPVRMDVVVNSYRKVAAQSDYVTVEGSGGILCPLCFDEGKIQMEDVINKLNLPSIIVADAGLGTINSVVLTVKYMHAKGLPIKGVIFNHYHPDNVMEEDNLRMCEYMTSLRVIACIQDGDQEIDIGKDLLLSLYE